MRDVYGTRFGVIATFTQVAAREQVAYLVDIDASGFVSLAGAGVFDDADQAAAWRAVVGDAAVDVPVKSVDDAVEGVAGQWIEGTLPETWYTVSPQRVDFQLGLLSDWIPDDPTTRAARQLLPEWVRWLGERSVAAVLSRP